MKILSHAHFVARENCVQRGKSVPLMSDAAYARCLADAQEASVQKEEQVADAQPKEAPQSAPLALRPDVLGRAILLRNRPQHPLETMPLYS